MAKYLIIKNIEILKANANPAWYLVGPPALTAFHGFIQALLLTLVNEDINETKNICKSAVIESINNEWYIVKKGDSFCKISKQLYGNESNYKEIIQLNNLTESTLLFPGDSLRIK